MIAGVDDPQEENDWDHALLSELPWPLNDERVVFAYAAWSSRMALDMARPLEVTWAADKMLSVPLADFLKNDLSRVITTFAIVNGSEQAVSRFASSYETVWRSQGVGRSTRDLTSALIERSARATNPYDWLAQAIDVTERNKRFADHLIDTLVRAEYPATDERARLTAIARTTLGDVSDDRAKQKIANIFIGELIRRLDDSFWHVVAAIEDSGLLSPDVYRRMRSAIDDESLTILKTHISWIGVPLGDVATLIEYPGASVRPVDDTYTSTAGGSWYRIVTRRPLKFSIDRLPAGFEAVLMDAYRSRKIKRTYAQTKDEPFRVFLSPGHYSLALRAHGNLDHYSDTMVTLSFSESDPIITVGKRTNPVEISESIRYVFDTGDLGGEGWLSVSLETGDRITVETDVASEGDDQLETSVSSEIFGELSDIYESLLHLDAWTEDYSYDALRERLAHIYERQRSARDQEISLTPVAIERLRQRLEDIFDGLTMHEAEGALGGRSYERLIELLRDIYYVWGSDEGEMGDLDTHLSLLERETDLVLAANDDVNGSYYSSLSYTADRPLEALIQVSNCCTEPFLPHRSFVLRIVVERDSDTADANG